MACTCIHANQFLKFPVFGPQPMGPAEFWPVYFVPDKTDPGYGHYHCPNCQDGLVEAREAAGMPPLHLPSPKTWLEQTVQFMESFIGFVFGIRPLPTAGESR